MIFENFQLILVSYVLFGFCVIVVKFSFPILIGIKKKICDNLIGILIANSIQGYIFQNYSYSD